MGKTRSLYFILSLTILFACNNGGREGTIEESGSIETTNSIVSSQSNGNIISIIFNEGERVIEGDTILIIDHELLDLQLKQAEAVVKAAEAAVELMKEGARSEDRKLAKEKLSEAEVALKLSKENEARMKKLFESQAITKKQYDDVAGQFEITQSRYNSAKQNLKKVENIIRPEELKQGEAKLEQANASLELLRKRIKDCYVTTPISGFIVENFVELGETAVPMSSLFKVADLSRVEISIYIPETKLGLVKLGQEAEISIDSFNDKTFTGKISYISPTAEFTPKTIQTKEERTKLVYKVKVKVENPDFILKEGMPADVVIELHD